MINEGPDHLQGNQCQGESQRTAILFDIRVSLELSHLHF